MNGCWMESQLRWYKQCPLRRRQPRSSTDDGQSAPEISPPNQLAATLLGAHGRRGKGIKNRDSLLWMLIANVFIEVRHIKSSDSHLTRSAFTRAMLVSSGSWLWRLLLGSRGIDIFTSSHVEISSPSVL